MAVAVGAMLAFSAFTLVNLRTSEPAAPIQVGVSSAPTTDLPPAAEFPPTTGAPAPLGQEGTVSPILAEQVAQPGIVRVPDPRPGDFRVDPSADTLPVGYAAGAGAPTELSYGPDPDQILDLYLPAEIPSTGGVPLIIFIHGGGWMIGDKREIPEMVLRFVEQGHAVASVNYRLAPDHPSPAQIHDIDRAVRWLKALGESEGTIDGERIVLYGISAGGHLATFTAATAGSVTPHDLPPALLAQDPTVAGVVSVVGITDVAAFYQPANEEAVTVMRETLSEALLGCDPCAEAELRDVSPVRQIGPDAPPAYFAYGGMDDLVEWESQGLDAATIWAEHAGTGTAWFDLIEDSAHNVEDHVINQRAVELFVAWAMTTTTETVAA